MRDRIQKLHFAGHTLWRVDGELQPVSYVRYLLRQRGITSSLHAIPTSYLRDLQVPLVALVRGRRIIGYRCSTWVGRRSASTTETRAFLRADGYAVAEVQSLLALARREPVRAIETVRRELAHGIAA